MCCTSEKDQEIVLFIRPNTKGPSETIRPLSLDGALEGKERRENECCAKMLLGEKGTAPRDAMCCAVLGDNDELLTKMRWHPALSSGYLNKR